ncbi:glutamine amidotransferase-related protein [Candidatus Pelagibacter sp. HIMB1542]|uniref:glutamine amidotransferase-related protein n=1 Tax=Candidatus Pelagibacter sp. HIMB1542 TaxID=3413346 RepID=UPI003F872100
MKIYITPKIIKTNKNLFEYSIDPIWFKYIMELGYQIEILDLLNFKEQLSKKKIKAIIFSGGNDLQRFNKKKENLIRDKAEKKILKFCIKNKIKVIGICRGFQIIAEYFKGNLKRIKNHVRTDHNLILNTSKSRYSKSKNIKVNSFHNFAIFNLNKNFEIISKINKDKSIEIAEHKIYKILCFMFHPERKNESQNKINTYIQNFLR